MSSALGTCRGNIVEEITSNHLLTSGYYWLFDNPYKPTGTSRSTTVIRSRPHFRTKISSVQFSSVYSLNGELTKRNHA